tara:strand:- start:890 stop:1738 length:849 start_codon:yes stop_codon:yes gene_type:complete
MKNNARLKLVQPNETKQIRTFRRGRISVRQEIQRQRILRNNLEKSVYGSLHRSISKVINGKIYLYKEYGVFEEAQTTRDFDEELLPIMYLHYQKIFKNVFKQNEETYANINKTAEAIIFGRNYDIERLIDIYNKGRLLFLSGISSKLANRIAKIITLGREEGLSLTAIAKNISEKVLPIGRSRAALIARTETHNAASFAHHQYHGVLKDNLGLSMKKRWTSTSDHRTRSAHNEANGQIVDMDENFIVGGTEMAHAGDPAGGAKNNVNCRCVIIYADARDIVI